jgi:hypothetical protein
MTSAAHAQTVNSDAATGSLSAPVAVVAISLVLPIALYLGNVAPVGRLLYPACNVALAGYLFARRSPWYTGHCLLVFCFVSLARRLIDSQAGWDPANPVLLTPYLCCAFTAISFVSYWYRSQPRYIGPVLVILCCTLYGLALAIVHERTVAGLADLLKWSVGPLFAVHVLANRDQLPHVRRILEAGLVYAGTAIAAYGIYQYISPPPWDVEWVNGVLDLGMTSVGLPEPFSLRVFSTLNSPGSLGAILSAGIIVAGKRSLPIAIPTISLMVVGLALCQYRAIWAATALAVLMIVVSRPTVLKPANILAVLAVGAALSSTALIPAMREALVQRASSLTALEGDESLEDRLTQYRRLAHDEELVVGVGLGQNGTVRKLDGLPPVVIDSGLIDIWQSMGVVLGTLFLAAILTLIVPLFTEESKQPYHLAFDRAITVATFAQLPMGSVHIGELGFCGWLFLALGIAGLTPAAAIKYPSVVSST